MQAALGAGGATRSNTSVAFVVRQGREDRQAARAGAERAPRADFQRHYTRTGEDQARGRCTLDSSPLQRQEHRIVGRERVSCSIKRARQGAQIRMAATPSSASNMVPARSDAIRPVARPCVHSSIAAAAGAPGKHAAGARAWTILSVSEAPRRPAPARAGVAATSRDSSGPGSRMISKSFPLNGQRIPTKRIAF